jgi:hypothetical protein
VRYRETDARLSKDHYFCVPGFFAARESKIAKRAKKVMSKDQRGFALSQKSQNGKGPSGAMSKDRERDAPSPKLTRRG